MELENNQLELANAEEIPESEVVYEGWSFEGGERAFGDAVEASLRAKGFEVRRETRTPNGPVDIHAYQRYGQHQANHQLIELKMHSDRRTAAHALGQLLFYQSDMYAPGQCSLWFASPVRPSERILKALERYEVRWCDAAADGFEAWPDSEVKKVVKRRGREMWRLFGFEVNDD